MKHLWKLLACALLLCAWVGCDNGGDEPKPEPPADPYADVAEDWQGQEPFFIITEAKSFKIRNLTPDGFLYDSSYLKGNKPYWTQNRSPMCGAPGIRMSEKNPEKPFEMYVDIDGDRATPFKNRKAYETACLEMGIRPATTAPNTLAALDSLPTYEVRNSHMMDYIENVEYRCRQVWFAGITPGENLIDTKTPRTIWQKTEYQWIEWFKNPTGERPDLYGSGSPYYHSSINGFLNHPWHLYGRPQANLWLVLADEPGIYDMTVKVTFHSGNTCEQSFKVRVEPEGYTE